MRSNASTAWMYFDSLVFIAHRSGPIQAEDFSEYIADMYTHQGITGAVVIPGDAAPGPSQRAEIQKWFESTGARVAVVSASLLVRGAVTALSWFSVPIHSFALNQMDAALHYVELPVQRHAVAKRALRSLCDSFATNEHIAL
jgi:hypothetical protein